MNPTSSAPEASSVWTPDEVAAYLNRPLLDQSRPMAGTEGMTLWQIQEDVLRGGRFRVFHWNFSLMIMSFQRSSGIYYIRAGQGAGRYAWLWTVPSLLVGWWGIPWGVFYTLHTTYVNCMGGKDVTADLLGIVLGSKMTADILAQAQKPRTGILLWLLRLFVLMIPVSIFAAIRAWSTERVMIT